MDKKKRKITSVSFEMGIHKVGRVRAIELDMSFSEYIGYLIRKDANKKPKEALEGLL